MNKSLSQKISANKIFELTIQFVFDLVLKTIRLFSKLFSKRGDNICVICIHKLGDSIFTFDAVNSIKSFFKENIFIVCHYDAKDIYALIHPEKFIVPIPKESFHFNDRYLDSKARKLLSSLNPKILIDLTGVMTSASLIFNSKAKKIIGMNRKIFRSIFDEFIEVNTNLKSTEIYTDAIKNLTPIKKIVVEKSNDAIATKKILIAPFAGWKSKMWGLRKFISLSEKLKNDFDIEFVFDSTPISSEIMDYLMTNEIKFSKTKTITELITKIKSVDMLIGNDSGPVQIAAILGKRTFSIYGPTNPTYHIPSGEQHIYIQKILPCSPKENERLCFTDGGKSGCPSFECLNLLTVDEVYDKIISSLKQ